MSISDRIKEAREAAGLSQSELARRLKVTPQAVQQWEEAKGTAPRRSRLNEVALELGVSASWLWFGEDKPGRPTNPAELRLRIQAEEVFRNLLLKLGIEKNNALYNDHAVVKTIIDSFIAFAKARDGIIDEEDALEKIKLVLKLLG